MFRNKINAFTIVEVIIVLAVAAIIAAIVFLVLPQANQTQRNTRRKNDFNRIQTAIVKLSAEKSDFWQSDGTDVSSEVYTITGDLKDPNSNNNYVIKIGSSPNDSPGQIVVKNNAQCSNGTFASNNGTIALIAVTEPYTSTTQGKNTVITGQTYCINN
jgi:prepilin-type N-terminal cleavage/methylation domain-containing protein